MASILCVDCPLIGNNPLKALIMWCSYSGSKGLAKHMENNKRKYVL
ncbi:unnamed protein product [Fusarium venenatum]|uniref:Uncharacterized protein n=1 Tax=Fusarium venenatum TaxID=56646 RepID=A0A2L2SPG0_9HYPO|nr:uncharacterized protein FVRRES_12425 [Fusarium venenatum]CEI39734.1 unnamed protein product [Fusarium venenatum]